MSKINWNFSTKKQRSNVYYFMIFVLLGFLILYGIKEKIYVMSIIFGILPFVYWKIDKDSPNFFEVNIEDDIQIGGTKYEFSQIKSFQIIEDKDKNPYCLRLKMDSRTFNTLDIPLTTRVNTKMLTEYLEEKGLQKLPEQKMSAIDKLIVILKI